MNLKQQVIQSLKKPGFPEFDFLFSPEVIQIAPELLNEFLEQEKQEFQTTLKTPDTDISFDTFEEFSLLEIFWSYLGHSKSVNSNDAIRKVIEDFEPKIMDFSNEVSYSKRYFEMYEYCLANCTLDSEQTKIISDSIRNYTIRGINLDEEKQDELKKINKELSELSTKFSNNSLDSENEFEYYIESDTSLKELPKDILKGAKKRNSLSSKGEGRGEAGYLFSSDASEYVAIMKYCDESSIRKDFYIARGSTASSGKYDNRPVVLETLKLKDKKAKLLGYANYAELSLEFKMADTPQQVLELTRDVAKRGRIKALEEVEMLKKYFDLEQLEDWDTGYYMRKYKQDNYNLDDKVLKPYFEYNNVLKGLHTIIEKLYGIEMKKIPAHNPLLNKEGKTNEVSQGWFTKNTEVYEVYKDNKLISYYFLDAFYRPEKRSGAWANNIRTTFRGSIPVVLNVCNFTPPDENGLSLLTKNDVETLFHEFGHATHEMSSKSYYSELSGFGVEWDFVEVPSQFMEHWTEKKESLDIFARHYETGETIPEKLLKNMEISSKIGNGMFTLGQSSFGIMDMQLHSEDVPESVEALDQKTQEIINSYSLNEKLPEYKMYASFGHIFAGGYAAGYYSYMWAEMLELDIWREFQKNGIFDTQTANNYFDNLLSAGSQLSAAEIFKNTMGREVDLQGFFEYKGI